MLFLKAEDRHKCGGLPLPSNTLIPNILDGTAGNNDNYVAECKRPNGEFDLMFNKVKALLILNRTNCLI